MFSKSNDYNSSKTFHSPIIRFHHLLKVWSYITHSNWWEQRNIILFCSKLMIPLIPMITYFQTNTDHVYIVHGLAPHHFILMQQTAILTFVCKIIIGECKADVDCQNCKNFELEFWLWTVRLFVWFDFLTYLYIYHDFNINFNLV